MKDKDQKLIWESYLKEERDPETGEVYGYGTLEHLRRKADLERLGRKKIRDQIDKEERERYDQKRKEQRSRDRADPQELPPGFEMHYNSTQNEEIHHEKSSLEEELKELQQKMMYYQAADDPSRYREETPEREALQRKIRELQNKLNPPAERKPQPALIRSAIKRFSMGDVQKVKQKFREDGTFKSLGIQTPRMERGVAAFYLRSGALPTQKELENTHEHDGPVPFYASEHPELEGITWELR